MELVAYWFIGSIVCGFVADVRGRNGIGYFVLSLLLSPILVGILVIALPSVRAPTITALGEVAAPETHVRCPECRELVRFDAKKCKHCSTALVPLPRAPG